MNRRNFRMAWRNLVRNRRRSVTTALAIATGFTGLLLLGGYVLRVESFLQTSAVYVQRAGHLAIYRRNGRDRVAARPKQYSLGRAEQIRIAEVLGKLSPVAFSTRYLFGRGLVGNGCRSVPFTAVGIELEAERRIMTDPRVLRSAPDSARPVRGRPLYDYAQLNDAVGLSTGLSQLLAKERVHDDSAGAGAAFSVPECPLSRERASADANVQLAGLTLDGSLSAIDGEMVNVFRTALTADEDSSIVMRLDRLQALLETELVTYVAVFLQDGQDVPAAMREVQAALDAAGLSVDVLPFDDERISPYYVGTMAMLGSIVAFFSVLVISVVGLAVTSTMTLTVLERVRELGAMRAMGYRRVDIRRMFLHESLLLAGFSVIAGAAASTSVAALVNAADIRFQPPGVSGAMQLMILPTATLYLGIALGITVLAMLATQLSVARTVRGPIVRLLAVSHA